MWLRAATQYAFVVRSASPGFVPPNAMADLAHGCHPGGLRGEAAATSFATLWPRSTTQHPAATTVLVATSVHDRRRGRSHVQALRVGRGTTIRRSRTWRSRRRHARWLLHLTQDRCRSSRSGTPPFNQEGRFMLGPRRPADAPDRMSIPLQITLPKQAMPANGWRCTVLPRLGRRLDGLVDLGRRPTPVITRSRARVRASRRAARHRRRLERLPLNRSAIRARTITSTSTSTT